MFLFSGGGGFSFRDLDFDIDGFTGNVVNMVDGADTLFAMDESGDLTLGANDIHLNANSTGSTFIYAGSNLTSGITFGHTGVANASFQIGFSNIRMKAACNFGWTDGAINSTLDTILERDAADTLALRRSTNAQAFRLYNTFTDASNYERGGLKFASNVLELFSEAAGTGTQRDIQINGANRASKISDPSGGGTQDAEARTAINAIIDALESHGLAATS